MEAADIVIASLTLGALLISAGKSPAKTRQALVIGGRRLLTVLPMILAIFVMVGMLEVFVPRQVIVSVLGSSRGILAPLLSALVGGVLTGPPVASYPIAYYLYGHGATVTSVVTFLVAWVAVGTVSLPIEAKFLSWRFAAIRWALMMILSLVVGLLMGVFL